MPKVIYLIAAIVILSSSCAGSASKRDSSQEAEDAARSALASMDGGGKDPDSSSSQGGNTAATASGGKAATQGNSTQGNSAQNNSAQGNSASAVPVRAKPAWVDTPDAVYDKQRYVSVVGYGSDRNQAERDALAKLVGIFGQSVQAEQKTLSSYSEAVRSGTIQLSGNSSVQNAVTISAEMDTLVGAEIADVWYDGKYLYYAAAVMEKDKTSTLYADLIRSNELVIADLVNLDPAEKNTMDAYSRYLLAATIADVNRIYANVLTVVGNTRGIVPAEMKKGDDYRLEAASIAKNIPIGITVNGDRSDRIKNAFSKSLSMAGFRSGGVNSRYMLKVTFAMTPVELPGQTNKFVRYQLNGALADTAEGNSVLVSYDASGREGHLTVAEAEERALRSAEKTIADEFQTVLTDYLSSLLTKRK